MEATYFTIIGGIFVLVFGTSKQMTEPPHFCDRERFKFVLTSASCNFDDDFCNYTTDKSGYHWIRVDHLYTTAFKDHSGSGLFATTNHNSGTNGSTAVLLTPVIPSGSYCIEMWINTFTKSNLKIGINFNSLTIKPNSLIKEPISTGLTWKLFRFEITTHNSFQIYFYSTKSNDGNAMGIDDVSIFSASDTTQKQETVTATASTSIIKHQHSFTSSKYTTEQRENIKSSTSMTQPNHSLFPSTDTNAYQKTITASTSRTQTQNLWYTGLSQQRETFTTTTSIIQPKQSLKVSSSTDTNWQQEISRTQFQSTPSISTDVTPSLTSINEPYYSFTSIGSTQQRLTSQSLTSITRPQQNVNSSVATISTQQPESISSLTSRTQNQNKISLSTDTTKQWETITSSMNRITAIRTVSLPTDTTQQGEMISSPSTGNQKQHSLTSSTDTSQQREASILRTQNILPSSSTQQLDYFTSMSINQPQQSISSSTDTDYLQETSRTQFQSTIPLHTDITQLKGTIPSPSSSHAYHTIPLQKETIMSSTIIYQIQRILTSSISIIPKRETLQSSTSKTQPPHILFSSTDFQTLPSTIVSPPQHIFTSSIHKTHQRETSQSSRTTQSQHILFPSTDTTVQQETITSSTILSQLQLVFTSSKDIAQQQETPRPSSFTQPQNIRFFSTDKTQQQEIVTRINQNKTIFCFADTTKQRETSPTISTRQQNNFSLSADITLQQKTISSSNTNTQHQNTMSLFIDTTHQRETFTPITRINQPRQSLNSYTGATQPQETIASSIIVNEPQHTFTTSIGTTQQRETSQLTKGITRPQHSYFPSMYLTQQQETITSSKSRTYAEHIISLSTDIAKLLQQVTFSLSTGGSQTEQCLPLCRNSAQNHETSTSYVDAQTIQPSYTVSVIHQTTQITHQTTDEAHTTQTIFSPSSTSRVNETTIFKSPVTVKTNTDIKTTTTNKPSISTKFNEEPSSLYSYRKIVIAIITSGGTLVVVILLLMCVFFHLRRKNNTAEDTTKTEIELKFHPINHRYFKNMPDTSNNFQQDHSDTFENISESINYTFEEDVNVQSSAFKGDSINNDKPTRLHYVPGSYFQRTDPTSSYQQVFPSNDLILPLDHPLNRRYLYQLNPNMAIQISVKTSSKFTQKK